ncbi:MAG: PAS domain-containing sensor histidine kinase [Polyangia bacterium]
MTEPLDDELTFRMLVEGVLDYAIFMLSPTGHVRSWNAGARRIKQYEASEILGKHFSIFYTPADIARSHPEEELAIAIEEGRFEEEGWRVRKDGSLFWANVVITAIRNDRGVLVGFAKLTRDLTERRKAEDQLRQSEMRRRLLIESIRDYAIFMLDPDGRVATWSRGAEDISGYRAEEIIGRHFSIFYPPADAASGKCERELAIAAETGRFEEEGWRVRKDGTRFWANAVISAIRDESQTLLGYAKITRDLTDRRQFEEERLRLVQTEEAVKLRDEFLSIASHELKTPLTSLQLQLSGMQRAFRKQPPDPKALPRLTERIDVLDREVDRIVKLVDDLLDVSRAASGHLQLDLEQVNLAGVVRQVIERFEPELQRAGCALTLTLDDSVEGRWDRLRLDQVVSNFLTNAIKYGPGQPINIEVSWHDTTARLAVRDRGIGIEPADQARIFDRFTRAVPVVHYGGLGLGLWIARVVVEALGGSIAVVSEPGQGAEFMALLPLAPPHGTR